MDCLFCAIANHDKDADVVYENDDVIAFRDIQPIAPVHVLVIPKEHIASINDLAENQTALAGELIMAAQRVASEEGIADDGYKLLIRVGHHGGQEVQHLHLHLIGGAPLTERIHPTS